jgi:hypothetical protein
MVWRFPVFLNFIHIYKKKGGLMKLARPRVE